MRKQTLLHLKVYAALTVLGFLEAVLLYYIYNAH